MFAWVGAAYLTDCLPLHAPTLPVGSGEQMLLAVVRFRIKHGADWVFTEAAPKLCNKLPLHITSGSPQH